MERTQIEYLQGESPPSTAASPTHGEEIENAQRLGERRETPLQAVWHTLQALSRVNTSKKDMSIASFPLDPSEDEGQYGRKRRSRHAMHVSPLRRDSLIFGWAVAVEVLFSLGQEVAKALLFPRGCDWNHAEDLSSVCARLGVYVIPMTSVA